MKDSNIMSDRMIPEYIFEASWEVCNMVGGIYTVLSTRALTLQRRHPDRLIFIGPDVWGERPCPYFVETPEAHKSWRAHTLAVYRLPVRIGRWKVPGDPIAVLVDYRPLMSVRNRIYGHVWERFGVNSIEGYGDYHDSSMFGYAAGMVIESFYRYFQLSAQQPVVAHFNEWQTSFGLYYVKEHLPQVATLFTTHATAVGRSIAGNNKPLYDYLNEYHGDRMARELNLVSKHSTEKTAARLADCFTTVSHITAVECAQLLEKAPEVVTPNGFENDFVPRGKLFTRKRKEARALMHHVADTLLGHATDEDALLVGTAGRYEYKNKGLDVFIESLKRLSEMKLPRQVVAFFVIPAGVDHPRRDLAYCLEHPGSPLHSWNRYTTHDLHDFEHDPIMSALRWFHLDNSLNSQVKVIFIPSYLDGRDGIFNKTYYDLLIGLDLTVFASYYEPWGYTPLESVAFAVPTITTDLSGFGQWVSPTPQDITHGVGVVRRSDYNGPEVARQIAEMISRYASFDEPTIKTLRKKAAAIAEKALWKHFIHHYEQAYEVALRKVPPTGDKTSHLPSPVE